MIPIMCVYRNDEGSDSHILELKRRLGLFAIRAYGEPAQIDWIEVSENDCFSGGKPSGLTLISIQVKGHLVGEERARQLSALADLLAGFPSVIESKMVAFIRDGG